MHIDRQEALAAFEAYVAPYDMGDPKIRLKAEHTLRVADLCDRIARSIGRPGGTFVDGPACQPLPPQDWDLAWLCGLLHDIGRFEQVRRYGTFSDSKSVPHAALGVQILFEGAGRTEHAPGATDLGGIRSFAPEADEDGTIRAAVAWHSDFRLPQGLDARTSLFCNILRDADKVDILKANTLTPTAQILDVPEDQIRASQVTDPVMQAFYQHRTLLRSERTTPADALVSYACFVFELVFPESLRAAHEQGHVFDVLERPFDNPRAKDQFARLDAHIREWVDGRLAQVV